MDALTVTASVVGLLSTSAKITSALCGYLAGVPDAPPLTQTVIAEVQALSTVLLRLQSFFHGIKPVPRGRASMLAVEHVVASLAACVYTFSELDKEVDRLGVDEVRSNLGLPRLRTLDTRRWVFRESEVRRLTEDVEQHKRSISLILAIITCRSSNEMQKAVEELRRTVEGVLDSNRVLAARLATLEATYSSAESSPVEKEHKPYSFSVSAVSPNNRSYEPLVRKSKPYSSSLFSSSVSSLISGSSKHTNSTSTSTSTTIQWSAGSKLTLADLCNMSVLSLPIYPEDLYNSQMYTFSPLNGPRPSLDHNVHVAPGLGKQAHLFSISVNFGNGARIYRGYIPRDLDLFCSRIIDKLYEYSEYKWDLSNLTQRVEDYLAQLPAPILASNAVCTNVEELLTYHAQDMEGIQGLRDVLTAALPIPDRHFLHYLLNLLRYLAYVSPESYRALIPPIQRALAPASCQLNLKKGTALTEDLVRLAPYLLGPARNVDEDLPPGTDIPPPWSESRAYATVHTFVDKASTSDYMFAHVVMPSMIARERRHSQHFRLQMPVWRG